MLLFQAVFLLLHPLLEGVPHGTLPPAGDGDAGPAAHAQLPGRKQVRLGQIDHIGAVGLQKAPIRQQRLCHRRKRHPQRQGGHVLPAGEVEVHDVVGALQIFDARIGQRPQALGGVHRDGRAVFRLGGPVQQGCQLFRTE